MSATEQGLSMRRLSINVAAASLELIVIGHGQPVRFVWNVCGHHAVFCERAEATRFADEDAAAARAVKARLSSFTIEPLVVQPSNEVTKEVACK